MKNYKWSTFPCVVNWRNAKANFMIIDTELQVTYW